MEYRVLGKTGLKISSLGFGGIPIQRIDAAGTRVLMRQLLASGVNYIDTARAYTVSEEWLGQALEGIRQHFILATKSMSRDREGMARDIDISLSKLRTDYIELYQVHNATPADLDRVSQADGAVAALMEARDAGKIGHIGVTVHTAAGFEKALGLPWVETIMFPYNIVETQGEDLIRRCKEQNIGFIVMKPLAGGAIDDPALALRFIAQNKNISVVIPGMGAPEEFAQNLAAWEDPSPLSDQELAKIDAIRKQLGTQFCRRCNYCAPCTAGISIPLVFINEGYLLRYGLSDWAKAKYFAMEKTAADCIGCGICESRCPYGLPIREMMKRAAAGFGG